MIKKNVLLAAFLICQMLFCQKSDSIYYDKDWEVTTKAEASFYRLMPLKQLGDLVLLQDFYIDGTPQFEGYTLKNNEDAYVGDIIWYDENGNDSSFRQYRNDTKNLTLVYYHANGKVRKKVQYKNGVKDGETVIFDENGEVLMKGNYTEGKPAGGDFETIDDYEYNASDHDTTTQTVTVAVEPLPMIYPESSKTQQKKGGKTITRKIFWKNSRHMAQEKIYSIQSYQLELVQQRNYDKSGKLVQTLNNHHFEKYGRSISNGTEYQYFLRNNFATGIKSTSNFINTLKSGKEINYFPNGSVTLESNYAMGVKEGEETAFSENGSVKNKRIYKEGNSFNGNFEERIGDINVTLNYVNGVKEGEAVAKNEQGFIVAKGIYKNGKAYNGTFVVETGNSLAELISVENFRKKGLQKIFSYRLDNIEKTYTIQNEKLNGATVFYNDNKAVATLEYKDDEPYNGTLIEGEKISVFRNGKIAEQTLYTDSYSREQNNIQKQKFYENGSLAKIKDYSFVITEQPQDSYEGVFKNGKPFSGYFETDASREFKQVNYFENGIAKFQYSNDYLKNMDNFRHQSYNIKSVYKDRKIYDGVEYVLNKKQFTSKYWKNGVLQAFDWDLFAMHYFNRLHFELKNNAIEISDMQANRKAEIKVEQSKSTFNKALSIDGKIIDTTRKDYLESKYKEGIIIYHEQNGKIISTTTDALDESIESSEGTELFYKVYTIVKETSTIQENFNTLAEKISNDKFVEETDDKHVITGIQIDSKGKPKDGILITSTQNNTYTLQLYTNRKLMKTIEKVSFDKVEEELKKLEKIN